MGPTFVAHAPPFPVPIPANRDALMLQLPGLCVSAGYDFGMFNAHDSGSTPQKTLRVYKLFGRTSGKKEVTTTRDGYLLGVLETPRFLACWQDSI